jgi:hypothetical protein
VWSAYGNEAKAITLLKLKVPALECESIRESTSESEPTVLDCGLDVRTSSAFLPQSTCSQAA